DVAVGGVDTAGDNVSALVVRDNSSGSTIGDSVVLTVVGQNSSAGDCQEIGFVGWTGEGYKPWATIGSRIENNSSYKKSALIFCTRGVTTNTTPTEALRLDSSQNARFAGNVQVGSDPYTLISWGNSNERPWLASLNNTAYASATYGWQFFNDSSAGDFIIKRNNNSTTANNVLTLSRSSGNATFAGDVTTDGIFKVDSAPDSDVIQFDQNGRKSAFKTYFSGNSTDSRIVVKVSNGNTNGTMIDALDIRPTSATFAGAVTTGGALYVNDSDFTLDGSNYKSEIVLHTDDGGTMNSGVWMRGGSVSGGVHQCNLRMRAFRDNAYMPWTDGDITSYDSAIWTSTSSASYGSLWFGTRDTKAIRIDTSQGTTCYGQLSAAGHLTVGDNLYLTGNGKFIKKAPTHYEYNTYMSTTNSGSSANFWVKIGDVTGIANTYADTCIHVIVRDGGDDQWSGYIELFYRISTTYNGSHNPSQACLAKHFGGQAIQNCRLVRTNGATTYPGTYEL
ncbi:MAG: hypothetical protein QF535_23245, partial [Anaerolineales bacterium]|nr:hypothetical protein [Anaerolineales bacterium]